MDNNEIEDASGLFHKDNKFTGMSGLSLNNNWIKNIVWNGTFPNLSYIMFNDNRLEGFDNVSIQIFPCLSSFDLSHNKIKKVGPNLNFKALTTLTLSKNELEDIKGINSPSLY